MTEAKRKRTIKLGTLVQLRERLLKWRNNRSKFGISLDTEVLDLAIENNNKFIALLKEMNVTELELTPNLPQP